MIRFGFAFLTLVSATMLVLAACGSFDSSSTIEPGVDAAQEDAKTTTPEEASVAGDSGLDGADASDPSILFSDDFEKHGCGRFAVNYSTRFEVDASASGAKACRACAKTDSQYIQFFPIETFTVGPGDYSAEAMVRVASEPVTKLAIGFFVNGTGVVGGDVANASFVKANSVQRITDAGTVLRPAVFGYVAFDSGACVDIDDFVLRKVAP